MTVSQPRIYLGGAGGAPTNNVISSLRASGQERLIGGCSNPADLMLADVDERYQVPSSNAPNYREKLLALFARQIHRLAEELLQPFPATARSLP